MDGGFIEIDIQSGKEEGKQISWGATAQSLLEYSVKESARETVFHESMSIFSKCLYPKSSDAQDLGLVVGRVQSGKTASFETVIALARDNGYKLVIILAGTTKLLADQSTKRLKKDLQVDGVRQKDWVVFSSAEGYIEEVLKSTIEKHGKKARRFLKHKPVLLTLLKHYSHIDKLSEVLEKISMSGIPTLIIDDEADQASHDAKAKKDDSSTTFLSILRLRTAIPYHTYLQYTATPQAPLLIHIANELSPRFVHVLPMPEGYVGGETLFYDNSRYIKTIPEDEIPSPNEVLKETPESLYEALAVYITGVAIGFIMGDDDIHSMLIHPSRLKDVHYNDLLLVRDTLGEWEREFALPDNDLDRIDLIGDFKKAYCELEVTSTDLPPFDQALLEAISEAIEETSVVEVNSNNAAGVNWESSVSHILVGGQSLDRGYTVKGLTVTYMSRGTGVGNADTIQQRARFFGFKEDYLHLCRVYLAEESRRAFEAYVDHERSLYSQLLECQEAGNSLKDWKRRFILDTDLKPCRQNVLHYGYSRWCPDRWWNTEPFALADELNRKNKQLIEMVSSKYVFQQQPGHEDRTPFQRHTFSNEIPLSEVLVDLVSEWCGTSKAEKDTLLGYVLQLSEVLEKDPDATCCIYFMSPTKQRERSVSTQMRIQNLYQGSNSKSGVEIYPGDRKYYDSKKVTIQIHDVKLIKDNEVRERMSILAIRIPSSLACDWLVQDKR